MENGINPHTGDVTPCIAPSLQYLVGENYYELLKLLPVPVQVEKDGNCAALGEKWTGNAIDLDSFCALVLGTGLGGGITAWEELIPLLNAEIQRQVQLRGLPALPVVKRCRHRNGANLIGAVYNLKTKEYI